MKFEARRTGLIAAGGVAVVVLVVLGIYLWPKYFEKVEETIETGESMEAMRNPYLGATRFLQRIGVDVDTALEVTDLLAGAHEAEDSRQQALPGDGDTLVISYSHVFENPMFYEPLIDWIRDGGHLILDLSNYQDSDETGRDSGFMDFLEVSLHWNDLFDTEEETLTDAAVWDDSDVLAVEFPPFSYLETERDELQLDLWDENGSHALEFQEGDGVVTVMSDISIWENEQIAKHDHATLLAHLLAERAGKVFFILKSDMPSLWTLIWLRGPEAAFAFMMLVMLMIWRLNNRFGPIIAFAGGTRRSLGEHLRASGRFMWQHRLAELQLDQVRDELRQHLEIRHPQWRGKESDEQIHWLAEKSQLDPGLIRTALYGEPGRSIEFTHIIRTLQTLRNIL